MLRCCVADSDFKEECIQKCRIDSQDGKQHAFDWENVATLRVPNGATRYVGFDAIKGGMRDGKRMSAIEVGVRGILYAEIPANKALEQDSRAFTFLHINDVNNGKRIADKVHKCRLRHR